MLDTIGKTQFKRKYIILYLGSPLFVAVVLFIIYFLKGIYPFGTRSVAYYDMTQYVIPAYYHTWDVLHGTKDMFWDWFAGTGGSMADKAGNYILNPINWSLFFIERNQLCEFMSYFLVLKMSLAAFSMSFYLAKDKNIPIFGVLLSGISYAFSGYVIQYYSVLTFLDIVIIFPLVVYSLDLMVYEKKVWMYIVMMTLGFITNIQMMYMVCIYIVVKVFLYDIWKNNKKEIAYLIAKSTLMAISLSAFSWMPMLIQLMHSSRGERALESLEYWKTVNTIICESVGQKHFMLYGCETAFAVIIILIIKKQFVHYKSELIMISFLVLPVFIESINILWHPGGYVQFPMRFGYMLSFECICLVIKHIKQRIESEEEANKKINIFACISIGMLPFTILVLSHFIRGFEIRAIRELQMYDHYFVVAGAISTNIFLALFSKRKSIYMCVVGVLISVQALTGAYSFISPNEDSLECDIALLKNAIEVGDEYRSSDFGKRAKNDDTSLITNWPFVTRIAAIEGWTWGINPYIREAMYDLGYSTSYTRLCDSGGTVFSDNLMGVATLISSADVNSALYSLNRVGKKEQYYDYKYVLPFAMQVFSNMNYEQSDSFFDNQNMLFKEVAGVNLTLLDEYDINELNYSYSEGDKSKVRIEIPVEGEKTIYLYSQNMLFFYSIIINSQSKRIPFFMYEDNECYPAPMNDGMLECGTFKDEVIVIELSLINSYSIDYEFWKDDIRIAGLDMAALAEAYENIEKRQSLNTSFEKNTLEINGTIENDGYMFIPVGYNEGWKALVNGVDTRIESGLNGAFILIPVKKGFNDIILRFHARGLRLGIICGVLCIILMLGYMIANRDFIAKIDSIGQILSYLILCVIFCSIVLFMYIIPLIAWIINTASNA